MMNGLCDLHSASLRVLAHSLPLEQLLLFATAVACSASVRQVGDGQPAADARSGNTGTRNR